MSRFRKSCSYAVLGSFCVLLCGCPEIFDTTKENLFVRVSSGGTAYTGAAIKVVNDAGEVLADARAAGGEHGFYLVELNDLTPDFTVTASGGTFDGVAIDGELVARISGFDPKINIAYVNVVTTLVDAYMKKHPETALDDARAAIRGFLELDETVDPAIDLSVDQEDFSQTEFMRQASENGGLQQFMAALLEELESGNGTHAFQPREPGVAKDGMAATACEFALTGLANGALSAVGAQSFGWAMSQVGLGGIFGGSGPAIDPQVLANMQHSLDDINAKLIKLTQTVDRQYAELKRQVNVTSYDVRMDLLKDFIDNVTETHSRMTALVLTVPTEANRADILSEKARLQDIISSQIENHLNKISEVLLGSDGRTPLLTLFSGLVAGEKRFFDARQSQAIQDKWDYFDVVQTGMIQMMTEYFHTSSLKYGKAKIVIDTYRLGQRVQQQGLRPRQLPAGYAIDIKGANCPVGLDSGGYCFDHLAPRMWKTVPLTRVPPYWWYWESLASSFQADWPIDSGDNPYFWRPGSQGQCGFWSIPSGAEMLDLISGWSGASPAQWLADQGALDPGFVNSPYKYRLTNATMTPVQPPVGFIYPTLGVFDLQTGKVDDFGCNDCVDRFPPTMNYMLVRCLAVGEFYYYL